MPAVWENAIRLAGLRRFAIAITILNLLGHFYFGFEQSWAQPLAALATAYSTELLLEWVGSRTTGKKPAYAGSFRALVDFLLPAHITALAVGMLIYTNERLGATIFAAAVSIASKALLRVPTERGTRHFFNPSNFGISVTLLCFPWVGIAPPYMFTENLDGASDWILPGIIICSGTFLNGRFTKRLPLIAAWLSAFALQALLRHLYFDSSFTAALGPMTGVAFILFTFYMLTEPSTTPSDPWSQVAFGAGVAGFYGLLMTMHIVFGLFFALCLVSMCRGAVLYAEAWMKAREVTMRKPEFIPVTHGD